MFPLLAKRQVESTFELRSFRKADQVALATVINENWGLKSSQKNAELAQRFGYAYLYYNLACSSFRGVAEYNGYAAGIVCAGSRKQKLPNLAYLLKAMTYALPLLFCREFKEQIATWKKIFSFARSQEKKLPREYKGKLYLLLTNSSCRGMGMGKKLLSSAEDYFILNGMKETFLCTDGNLSFYEAHGYKKVQDTVIQSENCGSLSREIALLTNS